MAYSLGDVVVKLKADTADLEKGLDNAAKSTVGFSDGVKNALNKTAVAMGVVGAGLTVFAKSATDFTKSFVKDSKALGREIGTTTIEASRLTAAFARMGVDANTTQTVFGIFSKKINEATNQSEKNRIAFADLQIQYKQTQADINTTTEEIKKNGDKSGELGLKVESLKNKLAGLEDQMNSSANTFDQLGISLKNADGTTKSFTAILGETADKFKAMPDGATKTALAMDLFGRSGKDMIKVLNLGSQGIQDLEAQADKLGLTLTKETIVKIGELVKSQKDLKEQTDALKIAVGTATAPALTKFNEVINSIVSAMLNSAPPIHEATVGFLAFGGPVLSGTAALIGFLANLDQALPALIKIGTTLRDTAVAQWLLNIAMDANPVGIIILALAALSVELYLLLTHFQEVSNYLHSGWVTALAVALTVIMPLVGLPIIIIGHWQALESYFVGFWQHINAIFNGIAGWFMALPGYAAAGVNGVIAWFNNMVNSAANAVLSIAGWFRSLPSRILGAIGNMGGLLYNAGVQLLEGMIHGITDRIGALISTIKNAVGSAVNAAKGVLGIHSPSTVFAEMGRNMAGGMMVGLNQGLPGVVNAVSRLGTGAAMAGGVSNSQQTNITGPIHIDSRGDADYFFDRLNRNAFLESKGVSPA